MGITNYLGKKLYENRLLYLDRWSILHFFGFLILGIYHPTRWGLVIIGTIIFEIFEIIMARKTALFKENPKDMFTDVLLNLSGYWLGQGGLL